MAGSTLIVRPMSSVLCSCSALPASSGVENWTDTHELSFPSRFAVRITSTTWRAATGGNQRCQWAKGARTDNLLAQRFPARLAVRAHLLPKLATPAIAVAPTPQPPSFLLPAPSFLPF